MSYRREYFYYIFFTIILIIFIINLKNLIIHGYFFTSLYIFIVSSFFILINKIKLSKFIYIYIIIFSLSFSLLLFDFFFFIHSSIYENNDNSHSVSLHEEGTFNINSRRIYSHDIPSGYLLRDGFYTHIRNYSLNGESVEIFNSKYNIIEGLRTKTERKTNSYCPDVFLLGGSHNFGWGLNFDQTLQGKIEDRQLSTINLSLPGFGLSNSLALYLDHIKKVECNKSNLNETFFIYRFISDHINRNIGKTSLNINGPNFFDLKSDQTDGFTSNCNSGLNCSIYLSRYFITRLNFYLLQSKYEKSSNIIGSVLIKYWQFQKKDFEKTVSIINLLISKANEENQNNNFLFFIDDGEEYGSEIIYDYLSKIPNVSILWFKSNIIYSKGNKVAEYDLKEMMNKYCTTEKTLSLIYDSHPSECANSVIYEILNRKLF